MARMFKEQEKEEVSLLPRIERVERPYHDPIDVLSRSADYLQHIQPEATYSSVSEADFASSVWKNISELKLEESDSLPSRFAKMLESI